MTENKEKGLFEKLWDKKVPQYLGTYFAIGFGLLQFLEFLSKRYQWNDDWIDAYLFVWIALLPAIAIMIYIKGDFNHSQKGLLKWAKILIFGNVAFALLGGGYILAQGTNAKSQTASKVVELTNEEGEAVQAFVPALNKVKTVACFQFENKTGDSSDNWWNTAFSLLLANSLSQYPEFYTMSEFTFQRHYTTYGMEHFNNMPSVGIQRKIAQKTRNDYFTRIAYSKENGVYDFKGKLYSSIDGKDVMDIAVSNEDPLVAIDEIQQQIVNKIPNALEAVENQTNLPVSALLTGNLEALKYFIQSRIAFYKNPKGLEKVVELAKKAIELDPTCSECQFYVGDPLYGMGRREESIQYIKNAIKYGATLPERMQFNTKATLYVLTNNFEAYYKLQELRRKMFPYDFSSYNILSSYYQSNYGVDSAKVIVQEAIENGNIERGLLKMYELQLSDEDFEGALASLNRLKKEFPDRDQDRLKFAEIYEKQGQLAKAKELFLEEETLDPLNAVVQTRLAYVDFKNQYSEAAIQRMENGYIQASTTTDSLSYIWMIAYFKMKTGQVKEALMAIESYEKYAVKIAPYVRVIDYTLLTKSNLYQSISQEENIKPAMDELARYSPESRDRSYCWVLIKAIENDYNLDKLKEKNILDCKEAFSSFGEGFNVYFDLILAYLDGDFIKAANLLEKDDKKALKSISDKYFVAKLYHKAGQTDKAIEFLDHVIQQKSDDPLNYYQMAVLWQDKDKKKANDYLDIALKYWKDADDSFIHKKRAGQLKATLMEK